MSISHWKNAHLWSPLVHGTRQLLGVEYFFVLSSDLSFLLSVVFSFFLFLSPCPNSSNLDLDLYFLLPRLYHNFFILSLNTFTMGGFYMQYLESK